MDNEKIVVYKELYKMDIKEKTIGNDEFGINIKMILSHESLPYNDRVYNILLNYILSLNQFTYENFDFLNYLLKPFASEYNYIKNFQDLIDFYFKLYNKFNELPIILVQISDLYYLNEDYSDAIKLFFEACEIDIDLFFMQEGAMGEDDGFRGMVKHYGKEDDWITYNLYMVKAYLYLGDDELKYECLEIYNSLVAKFGANNAVIQNQKIFSTEQLYK